MEVTCPHCKQQLEAPAELAGEIVECPACDGRIQLPALHPSPPQQRKKQIVVPKNRSAPSRSGPKASSGSKTKNCPHCGEQILAVATKCKHCGSEIGFAAALQQTGEAMQGCGCALTLLVTIPILIFIFFIGGC